MVDRQGYSSHLFQGDRYGVKKTLPSLFVICSISFLLFRRFYRFRLRNLFCNLLLSQTFSPCSDYKGLYFPVLLTPTRLCLWCNWSNRTALLSSKKFRTRFLACKVAFNLTQTEEEWWGWCTKDVLMLSPKGMVYLVTCHFQKAKELLSS